jgi:membrane protease YdiL (CAAX protease family)
MQSSAVDAKREITWFGPIALTCLRTVALLLALAFWYFYFLGDHPTALEAATSMHPFSIVLFADLASIIALLFFTRKEDIPFWTLFGKTERIGKDLLWGVLLAPAVLIVMGLSSAVFSFFIFGAAQPPQPDAVEAVPRDLSFWWYVIVGSATVGVTEELVYRGYALPRLEALSKSKWLALFITAVGFALQHIAMRPIGWRFPIFFCLSALPVGLFMGAVYLKQRRLMPLIVAHWLVGVIGMIVLQLATK